MLKPLEIPTRTVTERYEAIFTDGNLPVNQGSLDRVQSFINELEQTQMANQKLTQEESQVLSALYSLRTEMLFKMEG